MNYLLLTGLLFFALPELRAGSIKKMVVVYHIVTSQPDSSLDQNHAVFELRFLRRNTQGITSLDSLSIEYSCNGAIQYIHPGESLTRNVPVSPGTYQFRFYADGYYEITTDSIPVAPGYRTVVAINLTPIETHEIQNTVLKPVIYTYSPAEQEITVALSPRNPFTFTYPAYGNGWKGTAHPDGSMTIAGKTYPYLFWEGTENNSFRGADFSTGFVVTRSEVTGFLEEKLTEMGLNAKEQADFITFWGPRMAQSERGFVHFLFNEAYDSEVAGIAVEPAPESIFRVYILWVPIGEETVIAPEPQHLPTAERTGFHLIEWGGSELSAANVFGIAGVVPAGNH